MSAIRAHGPEQIDACRVLSLSMHGVLRSLPIEPPRQISTGAELLQLCSRLVGVADRRDLTVYLDLALDGSCPRSHLRALTRTLDELLTNAIEHGFRSRSVGHVFVQVAVRSGDEVCVSVSDDGWGFDSQPILDGNGFRLLRQLGDLRLTAPSAPFLARAAVTVAIPLTTMKS